MGFFAHTPGGSGYARASHAHTPTLARLSACGKYAALFFPLYCRALLPQNTISHFVW